MENKQEIIKAVLQFQAKAPKIELNSKVKVTTKSGSSYHFKYADLPYIMEKIQLVLTDTGIVVHFEINESKLILHLIHSSGQSLTSCINLNMSNNPQENGSLITYYKRYLLTSALNLVADEDEDGNINVGNNVNSNNNANYTKKWLNQNTKEWEQTVKKLTSGTVELKKVLEHFNVSKDNQEVLKGLIEKAIEEKSKNN